MLQINVSQQLKSTVSTRNYHVDGIVDIWGDGSDSKVEGEVTLIRTGRGILVTGALETEVGISCCRCLSMFSCPLTLNIEEEYFPTIDITRGVRLPPPDEPGSFTIDEHHIIDLTEAIRQYALLAIPMKPLCRDGCKGLCPTCGHNLNEGQCDCPFPEIDPRWAKLRELASANDTTENKQKGNK